ncbi:MAG: hypothetical protein A2X13_04805 [Bacteroidetes bacterium GWC2_33_15]|nr:MAG: hypothetical protein A2X10_06650 [Bacteroidetes bacterium GWA2_33_15]OFX49843.1 MAG: hypothetical protein A2X13_04805 [Bacteroidetes bacterium GWC2_33_15]OFX65034.1 MAG: hypothetical protein A2X15_06725 [Bacteroidetes bacterium GWB2_32_14]OFX69004.1 MAG: hypothetical protein A2X14_13430 [Bacteroidetes bacterium GWD2_33_33]HAN18269.1 hypothetical protein [Bacteroidales bacterium]
MPLFIQIILFACCIHSQEIKNIKFIKDIQVKADFISTDQFNNIYVVNKNETQKISASDNSVTSYSNTLTGQIKWVDTSDPFRTMLYYSDFNLIVFLNNKLAEITGPVYLNELGLYSVGATCSSINGGFWIFDLDLFQLVYIDKNRKQAQKSSNLQALLGNMNGSSKISMFEKNEYIYLGIQGKGVFQFDTYGTFIKLFPIEDITYFQVVDSNIIYYTGNKLKAYNTIDYETVTIQLPEENVIQCRIEGSIIFLLTKNRISLYNIDKLNTFN